MRTNTTELDALPGLGEGDYYAEIGFVDAAKASWKQMAASGRSTSGDMYKKEVGYKQLEGMLSEELISEGDYALIAGKPSKDLEMYEDRYQRGKLYDNKVDTAYTNYFNAVKNNNLKDSKYIADEARGNAARDHYEAEQELQKVDSIGGTVGTFVGGMGSAMLDPINLALLPVGGSVVRTATQGTLATAGKAAVQEMGIAAVAEPIIQISEYGWKDEIGVDYTFKDAAFNASVSILGAGAVRGVGSGMMDLTEDGLKALRKADPDLADEYTDLTRNNISPNVDEHMDNLTRIELGEDVKFTEETPAMAEMLKQPVPRELKTDTEILADYAESVKLNTAGMFPENVQPLVDKITDNIIATSGGKFDASDMIPRIIYDSKIQGKKNSTSQPYMQNNQGTTYGQRWSKNEADDSWNITQKQAERIYNGRATKNDISALDKAVNSRLQNEIELILRFVDYDGELSFKVGDDINGEPVMMTYKELDMNADKEINDLARIRDCMLGGA